MPSGFFTEPKFYTKGEKVVPSYSKTKQFWKLSVKQVVEKRLLVAGNRVHYYYYYYYWNRHRIEERVPAVVKQVRIWHCFCSSWDHCWGGGSIPSPAQHSALRIRHWGQLSLVLDPWLTKFHALWVRQKKKKERSTGKINLPFFIAYFTCFQAQSILPGKGMSSILIKHRKWLFIDGLLWVFYKLFWSVL